jgi:hypothetical protein
VQFYKKESHCKEPEYPAGVKALESAELGPYMVAHAQSFSSDGKDKTAWASVILLNRGTTEDTDPIYHGRGRSK